MARTASVGHFYVSIASSFTIESQIQIDAHLSIYQYPREWRTSVAYKFFIQSEMCLVCIDELRLDFNRFFYDTDIIKTKLYI